ncbi:MAG: hypothetical protein P8130_15315, partial [Deltaproteobacteria bacterium]
MLLDTGKCARDSRFYFTEDELSPGAVSQGRHQPPDAYRRLLVWTDGLLERVTLDVLHHRPGVGHGRVEPPLCGRLG